MHSFGDRIAKLVYWIRTFLRSNRKFFYSGLEFFCVYPLLRSNCKRCISNRALLRSNCKICIYRPRICLYTLFCERITEHVCSNCTLSRFVQLYCTFFFFIISISLSLHFSLLLSPFSAFSLFFLLRFFPFLFLYLYFPLSAFLSLTFALLRFLPIHLCIYIDTYTYMYIYTHICIHTYTHM